MKPSAFPYTLVFLANLVTHLNQCDVTKVGSLRQGEAKMFFSTCLWHLKWQCGVECVLRLRLVVVGVCSLSARSQRSIGVKSKSGAGHCWGWLVLQLCPLSRDILRSSSANIHDVVVWRYLNFWMLSAAMCFVQTYSESRAALSRN